MNFLDIPQLPKAHYEVNMPWDGVEDNLQRWMGEKYLAPLNLEPDFQRAHVWTPEQQTAFIEYSLRGGEVGRVITFNCPGWMTNWRGPFEIVDGKQRLEAVRAFLRDEVKAFGLLCSEFEGRLPTDVDFRFRVCTVATRREILEMYLNINAGGTPHSQEELDRVRELFQEAIEKEESNA